MLFVIFFVVSLFAIPLTAEVILRGADNIIVRASKEVEVVIETAKQRVSEKVTLFRVVIETAKQRVALLRFLAGLGSFLLKMLQLLLHFFGRFRG